MTENIEEYQKRIAELEKQLEEAKKGDESLNDIKNKYDELINKKDEEIKNLQQEVESNQKKIDKTVGDLNNEVQAKLEQTEAYKELLSTVEQLEKERAEATVDAYIQKGLILPAQKEAAQNLCLTNNEAFLNLYRDAKPIVETQQKRKSIPAGTAERIANYFKN